MKTLTVEEQFQDYYQDLKNARWFQKLTVDEQYVAKTVLKEMAARFDAIIE